MSIEDYLRDGRKKEGSVIYLEGEEWMAIEREREREKR